MNYYNEIKNELINNEITKRIKDYSKNKSDLTTYYNVGKLLSEAGKHYGEGIINEYSKRLTNELGKGYGVSSLKNMRKLYELFSKSQTVSDFLSYSHYVELMAIDNINKIKYYIKVTEQQNLSVRELRREIKNKAFDRLSYADKEHIEIISDTNNTPLSIKDMIKDPIILKSDKNIDKIDEQAIYKYIISLLEDKFLELGTGFALIGHEYKLHIDNKTKNKIYYFLII